MRCLLAAMMYISLLCFLPFSSAETWMNPGPYGADFTSITIHPTNDQILYAGTMNNGAYTSKDGGLSWEPINQGFPIVGEDQQEYNSYYEMMDFYCHPSSENLVILRMDYNQFPLWKSIDGGQTWVPFTNGLPGRFYVYAFWIHPEDANYMIIGTDSGEMYRTSDGGEFWSSIEWRLPEHNLITEIGSDPFNPDHLLLYCWFALYESFDLGETWTFIRDYPELGSFRFHPLLPNHILARTYGLFEDLRWSPDFGRTWIVNPSSTNFSDFYDLTIDNLGNCYVATDAGLYRLDEFNGDLQQVGPEILTHIVNQPDNPEQIISIQNHEIRISYNSGVSYERRCNGIKNASVMMARSYGNNPTDVICSTHAGVQMAPDDWIGEWKILFPRNQPSLQLFPGSTDTMFTPSREYFLRSYNGGATWDTLAALDNHDYFGYNFYFLEDDPTQMFTRTRTHLQKRSQMGEVIDYETELDAGMQNYHYFAVDPVDPDYIYQQVRGNNLIRSTDGGLSFPDTVLNYDFDRIKINPENRYLYVFYSLSRSLRVSEDLGDSFHSILFDEDMGSMSEFQFRPGSDEIYVCGFHGLWFTRDDGESWERIDFGYPYSVYSIAFSPDGNIMYVGTSAGSMWTFVYDEDWVAEGSVNIAVPEEMRLLPAYPNPFNPSFTIPFDLPQSGEITFELFNILGQQIHSEALYEKAGYHSYQFNSDQQISELVSGVYFIQIQFNNQLLNQKVVLLK